MVPVDERVAVVSEFLSGVSLGEPRTQGSLVLFPLLSEREAAREYLVLAEALAQKMVEVTEREGGASVPELLLNNGSDKDVLMLDGEMVVGGMQDRVLAISILAAAKSKLKLPVACTEAGRWGTRRSGMRFASADWHSHAKMRAHLSEQVSASLAFCQRVSADQGDLWDEQSRSQRAHRVASPTSRMTDVYDRLEDQLGKQLDTFKPEANQVGALVMMAGSVVGLDAFDQAATYEKLHDRLARGYGLDVLELEAKPVEPKREVAAEFLRLVAGARDQAFPTVGRGEQHRLENGGVTGSALAVEGKVIHLSAFAQEDQDGRIFGAEGLGAGRITRRRRVRSQ